MSDARIQALTKLISETRPIDRLRRQGLVNEIRELRRDLDPRAQDQAQRLDAALLLMEFMNRSEELATAEGLRIVAGLVGSVDGRMLQQQPRRVSNAPQVASNVPAPSVPTSSNVAQHADLRLTEEFLLGTILVQAKIVTPDAVQRALHLQSAHGHSLGQCLIMIGAATPGQIAAAVTYQDRMRERERSSGAPVEKVDSETRPEPEAKLELRLSSKQKGFVQSFHGQVLGEVLIRLGAISREQLDRALQFQRAASVHIGEALVQSGATDWDTIRRGLEVQRQLRRSA